jgi:hypothetical protein
MALPGRVPGRFFAMGEYMSVEIIDDKTVWDTFIDESRCGLLFHKWDFLRITGEHTGCTVLPFGVYRGENLICLFPLFVRKVMGTTSVFSPPPLQATIPYLGPVLNREYATLKQSKKEARLIAISEEMEEVIRSLAPNYISIYFTPNFLDVRPFRWEDYAVDIRYTYVLDLAPSIDEIWNGLHNKLRSSIKRAEKAGYELVREEDLTVLYEQVARRFHDPSLNIPMIRRSFFEDLIRAYPGRIGMYTLQDREGTTAAVVMTQEYRRFLMWIGTPKMEGRDGNAYLTWLLIQKAKSEGFGEFENIGATNKNLNSFKSKFNPDIQPYLEIRKKDAVGRIAEWGYINVLKKMLVKAGRY